MRSSEPDMRARCMPWRQNSCPFREAGSKNRVRIKARPLDLYAVHVRPTRRPPTANAQPAALSRGLTYRTAVCGTRLYGGVPGGRGDSPPLPIADGRTLAAAAEAGLLHRIAGNVAS